MPIRSREDAIEVDACMDRLFQASSTAERAVALREMFVEVLDFDISSGQVSLAAAPTSVNLPAAADRLGISDGVEVVYIDLNIPQTDRVRKAEAVEAAKLIANQIGDDLLLVFTNTSTSQLHVIHPDFGTLRPTLRRIIVERDLPRRTAVQQISNIYWKHLDTGSMRAALHEAFDVEPVTKAFFAEYKRVFEFVETRLSGFSDGEEEAKRLFAQTLFNRLMFVYFLQRKGWLAFEANKDYLNALWADYANTAKSPDVDAPDFYNGRLKTLFFGGLNNYESRDATSWSRTRQLIGDVPFLNGGLFAMSDEESRSDIVVPDECISEIFTRLFDRFNFTVMESTPFDIEVAVDPEMLGKVFEELVTGRNDSGSYYTPRLVVSYMCREALKGYLEGRGTGLTTEQIAKFVDERDTDGVSLAAAAGVAEGLDQVTVVDPACGSGAYLLGMMQELVELQTTLYNVGVDSRGLYDLKLHIIQRNLYGVDNDEFAVNIAMLRLWLSLAIEYEGDRPEPLPNLDFKIVCGDSLLGPDPSSGVEIQGTLGRDAEKVRRLGQLKAEFMRASLGADKERLRSAIREIEKQIEERLGGIGVPDGAMDWRVAFAEIFTERKGFDVAIANPPYIQLQREGGKLRRLYSGAGYETFSASGDIYQLFYERGCQLLSPSRGLLVYISSNSWIKAKYGGTTRRYLTEKHTPLGLLDVGKDVFESAIVDTCILLLREGIGSQPFPAVDMDSLEVKTIPPEETLWGQVRPDGEAPWSILSPIEKSVMDKMIAKGTPLKDWDVKINRGITTGYNRAFIIDDATRQALIEQDANSAEIIMPILRGRDIQRYRVKWADRWLIDVHNGYGGVPAIDIEDYPSVKDHLDAFYPRLERRYDKGRTPYNLRNCAYHEDFAKEKLLWMDLTETGRFALDTNARFCLNTAFIVTGPSMKFLCAVLNSQLVTWFVRHTGLNSGMGVPRWIGFTVESVPVPELATEEQRPFIRLVDEILETKGADPDANTRFLEWDIDRLVYDLYGLTEEEDTAIERSLGLIHQTDQEEDTALVKWMMEPRTDDPDDFVSEEIVMATLQELDEG